jgi:hypothetical protein
VASHYGYKELRRESQFYIYMKSSESTIVVLFGAVILLFFFAVFVSYELPSPIAQTIGVLGGSAASSGHHSSSRLIGPSDVRQALIDNSYCPPDHSNCFVSGVSVSNYRVNFVFVSFVGDGDCRGTITIYGTGNITSNGNLILDPIYDADTIIKCGTPRNKCIECGRSLLTACKEILHSPQSPPFDKGSCDGGFFVDYIFSENLCRWKKSRTCDSLRCNVGESYSFGRCATNYQNSGKVVAINSGYNNNTCNRWDTATNCSARCDVRTSLLGTYSYCIG